MLKLTMYPPSVPCKAVFHQIVCQLVVVSVGAPWKPLCFAVGVEMFPGWNGR